MKIGYNGRAVPGPTNMPVQIRQAMEVGLQDHRAPDFPDFTRPLFEDLTDIFMTRTGRGFIYPCSGTGSRVATITNTLSEGDKVLASAFGQFSLLWVELCQRFGLEVDAFDVEWGKGVPLGEYRWKLAADTAHPVKAVLVTRNETATGVTSDVAGVRKILDEPGSPRAAVRGRREFGRFDRLPHGRMGRGRDRLRTQKGFMMPAGLAVIGVSLCTGCCRAGRLHGRTRQRHWKHTLHELHVSTTRIRR